jgi:hypothetical protein
MTDYHNLVAGYSIKYPKGWIKDEEGGSRARFFNATDVDKRFLDPTGPFPDGVVMFVELTQTNVPDSTWRGQISEMGKEGFVIGKEEHITVGGKQSVRIPYSGNYTPQIKETGYHIFINADTVLYDIRCAGFGGMFEAYRAYLDACVGTFEFPKPVEKGRDVTLPADVMTEYDAKLFTFQYPDNYNFETIPKGNNELALSLRGANRSCSIQFIVFGAKGLTLEKVFDQNKGKYAGATVGKATVGGERAITQTYSATRDVERRFYFIVRNDKVYRITMDWYRPQTSEYQAAYEKVINSVKFK